MKKSNPEELFAQGAHLGHLSAKIHPRAKKYVYKIEKGTAIIDLFKTAACLDKAKDFVFNLGKESKTLLVFATKSQAKDTLRELCRLSDIFYMTKKWVGGFLTNFEKVSQNIKKLSQMKKEQNEGFWNNLPKHERLRLEKKLRQISSIYEGVEKMEKLPDALFIIDIRREKNAVLEARQREIPVVAVVDTNCNPDLVNYPIPANDDAVSSIKYIAEQIIGAYNEGRKQLK